MGMELTSDFVTATATVVLVAVTGVYVVLTYRLVLDQRTQLDLASQPLLACRLTGEGDTTALHLENAGENVILDIDAVVLVKGGRTAKPVYAPSRHRVPWLPAKGAPPAPRTVAPFGLKEGVVLIQYQDARGQRYAQVQFYELDEAGNVEASLYPALGERRSAPIPVGTLSSPALPDEEVGGYPLSELADRLRHACEQAAPRAAAEAR